MLLAALVASSLWLGSPREEMALAGLFLLTAVAWARRDMQAAYGEPCGSPPLLVCGIMAGLGFWLFPAAGGFMLTALTVSSGLHHFLHEREEKNLTFRQVSNRAVLRRWLGSWGLHGLLVALLLAILLMIALPQADDPWRPEGYFWRFHTQWLSAWQTPGGQGAGIALWLLLIGSLPVFALVYGGWYLRERLMYRLIQQADEEWLLFWLGSLAMVGASLSAGDAAAMSALGPLPFLLGFWGMQAALRDRPGGLHALHWLMGAILIWAVLGMAFSPSG